jgi:hypothetical protein
VPFCQSVEYRNHQNVINTLSMTFIYFPYLEEFPPKVIMLYHQQQKHKTHMTMLHHQQQKHKRHMTMIYHQQQKQNTHDHVISSAAETQNTHDHIMSVTTETKKHTWSCYIISSSNMKLMNIKCKNMYFSLVINSVFTYTYSLKT